LCIKCRTDTYNRYKKSGKSDKESIEMADKLCTTCECKEDNINLNQIISVDFTSLLSSDAQEQFKTALTNSIYNKAYQTETNLSFGDNDSTITNISNNILDKLQSTSVQQSLQAIRNIQIVQLNSPGSVTNVDFQQSINFVSSILETDDQISGILNDLETQIINASEQVTEAGINQVIVDIVLIIMIVIALIIFIFSFNLLIELYTLYTG
jgi:hypothetical protein